MKSAVADFDAGIDQLLVFLERAEREHELITLLNDRKGELRARELELLDHLVGTATNTKQYIYAVSIVSLYGLLERLVDKLVIGFVMKLNEYCDRFEKLPEVVRKNHLQFSLDLADALIKDNFRTQTSHEEIIANFHSCRVGSADYRLNGLAFALHRGNITLNRIAQMLCGIGVQSHHQRIARTPAFSHYLNESQPERNVSELNDQGLKSVFDPIDDLVERRNGISHGVLELDDIESTELLKERCAFVRAYGKGFFEQLLQEILKFAAESGIAQKLGQPIVVHDHRIVCFETSCHLAVGDNIFALTSDGLEPVRVSEVISLEVNYVGQQAIRTETPIQFGVQVEFYANMGYHYYSLPAGA